MKIATQRWLHLYKYTTLGIQVFLLIAYGVVFLVADLPASLDFLTTITALNALIAAVHILFTLFAYDNTAKKNSLAASTISGALLAVNVMSLMHASGELISAWLIAWGILCLIGGILGPAVAAAPGLLVAFYFILRQVSAFNIGEEAQATVDIRGLIVVAGTFLLCAVSWIFWRRFYINTGDVEVKRLSGQLKSRQQLSEILVQSITDGIIVTDTTGKISIVNPAAAKMTEWSVEEATGIDVRLVVSLLEEDGKEIAATDNVFSAALTKQKPVEKILQLIGRNGKKLIVSLVVSPITIPQSNELAGAVAVVRDISNARAEEARRADFISTASHEMRTPVAAIEGYLALSLNEKVSKIDNNARSYLMKAYASTQHLGKLFQDLLTSAKAEDGRLVSHPAVLEVGEYIEQLTSDLRFGAEKKGLLVDLAIGSNAQDNTSSVAAGGKTVRPLYYTMADADRLREVITNLFDNAVKYTPEGKISVGLTGNNNVIQLYIKDTGPGIPAEDIPHLFQKFYRVDNSATRTVGGTGLGLFICRKIVELYNGRIWAESDVGKGSTFYINLPRISTHQATVAQKTDVTT